MAQNETGTHERIVVQSLMVNNRGTVDQDERRRARMRPLSLVSRAFARPLDMRGIAETLYSALEPVLGAPIWFVGRYDQARQSVEVVDLPESSTTAPMLLGQEVLGVVSVQDYRPMAFDQDDLALLQEIANKAAYALRTDRATPGADVWQPDLQAVSGNSSDAILLIDCVGQVVGLNKAARGLFCGDGKSIILGRPLDSLAEPRIAEKVTSIVALLKTGKTPSDVEVMIGDGERRRVSVRARPARAPNGRPAGIVILLHEVDAANGAGCGSGHSPRGSD